MRTIRELEHFLSAGLTARIGRDDGAGRYVADLYRGSFMLATGSAATLKDAVDDCLARLHQRRALEEF